MRKIAILASLWLILAALLSGCASTRYAAGGVVVVRGSHTLRATIQGSVSSGGGSIPGAQVAVAGYGRAVYTDGRGNYRLYFSTQVPAGVHRMSVKLEVGKPGFLSRTVAITVRENTTTTARISLKPTKVIVVR